MIKAADHPKDRLTERTQLSPDIIARLREQANHVHVHSGDYYLPLKDRVGNHAGYAAFKTIPGKGLVLATILSPGMVPRGTSLSHVMRQPVGLEVGPEQKKFEEHVASESGSLFPGNNTHDGSVSVNEKVDPVAFERKTLHPKYMIREFTPAGV